MPISEQLMKRRDLLLLGLIAAFLLLPMTALYAHHRPSHEDPIQPLNPPCDANHSDRSASDPCPEGPAGDPTCSDGWDNDVDGFTDGDDPECDGGPAPDPSPSPSADPSPDPSPTPTESPTAEPSPTSTPDPSPTPTESPTAEPSPTSTPDPTESPTPSPEPTESPTSTPSPSPSPPPDPACSDGQDNDGDGFTDWPLDRGCSSPTDDDELDSTDLPTPPLPGVSPDPSPSLPGLPLPTPTPPPFEPPPFEPPPIDLPGLPDCMDGEDNDGDGVADYPADIGCTSPIDDDESNDGGGGIGGPSCSIGLFDSTGLGPLDPPGTILNSERDEDGLFSKIIHEQVESRVGPLIPLAGDGIHEANCTAVITLEDLIFTP